MRGIFWEGSTYKFVEKGGIFWEGGVNSGRVENLILLKKGYILGGRGRFWKGRIYKFVEKGVYCGRDE